MNPSQKLDSILMELEMYRDFGGQMRIKEAKKQLYELLVGEMPKDKNCISKKPMDKLREEEKIGFINNVGWNNYRESMLTILKGLFQ